MNGVLLEEITGYVIHPNNYLLVAPGIKKVADQKVHLVRAGADPGQEFISGSLVAEVVSAPENQVDIAGCPRSSLIDAETYQSNNTYYLTKMAAPTLNKALALVGAGPKNYRRREDARELQMRQGSPRMSKLG